jgi:hypothetical protein
MVPHSLPSSTDQSIAPPAAAPPSVATKWMDWPEPTALGAVVNVTTPSLCAWTPVDAGAQATPAMRPRTTMRLEKPSVLGIEAPGWARYL